MTGVMGPGHHYWDSEGLCKHLWSPQENRSSPRRCRHNERRHAPRLTRTGRPSALQRPHNASDTRREQPNGGGHLVTHQSEPFRCWASTSWSCSGTNSAAHFFSSWCLGPERVLIIRRLMVRFSSNAPEQLSVVISGQIGFGLHNNGLVLVQIWDSCHSMIITSQP